MTDALGNRLSCDTVTRRREMNVRRKIQQFTSLLEARNSLEFGGSGR
jgi:hypothetical protein